MSPVAACKECRNPTLEYQNRMTSEICKHLAMQSTLFFLQPALLGRLRKVSKWQFRPPSCLIILLPGLVEVLGDGVQTEMQELSVYGHEKI